MDERLKKKIESGRTYRSMAVMTTRAMDDGSYIVEGYATVFNEPYLLYKWSDYEVNEQISNRAFDECDMDDVIFQYDHVGRVFARSSNKTLELEVDEHGLKIRADLGGTEAGRQLYEEIKGGYTTKMSFGFMIEEDERVWTKNHETGKESCMRTITKISKLYDVSAVSLPANDATEISARNQIEGVISQIVEERNAQIKKERLKAECLALLNL